MGERACAAFVALALMASAAAAQTTYRAPRLPDGKPDLQGVWDFRTLTPLQRPDTAGDKAVLTPEEAAALEAKAAARSAQDNAPTVRSNPLKAGGEVGAYNSFWVDQGAKVVEDQRTSLIVDPPDGRLPTLQSGAQIQTSPRTPEAANVHPVRLRTQGFGAESYEDRGLAERCLLGFNSGPPIVPAGYNQNIQIVQTRDHVVILNEMVHDARIVPIDGRPHLPAHLRRWMGDSRGRWEGDTLVTITTNFTHKTASFNPSFTLAIGNGTALRLTERFRRVADDTLMYEYTVDDPATFTRPFTVRLPMRRGEELFEYACHEANYGLGNILRGARAEEQEAGK